MIPIEMKLDEIAKSGTDIRQPTEEMKDLREWWVLGKFAECLAAAQLPYPCFARRVPSGSPDFETFAADGLPFAPIEVTEIIRPGRRRGQELREERPAKPLFWLFPQPDRDPFQSFRSVLAKKCTRGYGDHCVLLVYFNIWNFRFPIESPWPKNLLGEIAASTQPGASNPDYIKGCQFREIVILDPSGTSLVRIYPDRAILKAAPDRSALE